jgi:ABC-type dipeptide/oligopeptide/nickel transport system permease component
MFAEFKRTLRKNRGQMIGWGIGLAMYSLLMIYISSDISQINLITYIENLPEELLAFFGSSLEVISTPEGYLDFYFFSGLIVIFGILAVGNGARMLVLDKNDGLLDFMLTDPIGKTKIFWGRALGYSVTWTIILGIAWLVLTFLSRSAGLNLIPSELIRPFLPLFGQLMFFGFLALFLSLLLSSSRIARAFAGTLFVLNYLLLGLSNISEEFKGIVKFTPLHIYQDWSAIGGLNWDWLVVISELIIILLLFAWWLFLKRDFQTGGESERKRREIKRDGAPLLDVPFLNRIRQPILFLGQRLLFGLLVLSFITYASFLGLDMARGTTFHKAAGDSITKTINYAADVVQGDLGETSSGSISLLPKPVVEVVPQVLQRSLGLLGASLILSAVLGVLLGVIIAGKRSGITLLALLGSILGVSIPSFFAALLLQLGVIKLNQFYGQTLLPVGGLGWDEHIILPTLVLAARPLAQITRVTYVTVDEVLKQDYVRTAYSKGLRYLYVTVFHIIRNAAVPVLTTIGLSLRFALSSLPIVEFFFGWQGLGFTLLQSISNRDDHLTIVLALCLGILFILVNLLLDGSYLLIDPRLRDAESKVKAGNRAGLLNAWKRSLENVQEFLKNKPWRSWIRRTQSAEPSPFREIIDSREGEFSYRDDIELRKDRVKVWIKGTLGNPALLVGGVIVLAMLGLMLFSPQLSPHSPYMTQGMTIVEGEFIVPPFEPDDVYPMGTDPLGRDIMSLILAGAQQTFTLAFTVVTFRLVIGFVLGATVGWFTGSWLDRIVLGAAETIAAFPALLLVMVLILGIGIRQGMRPFIIALSFIGWSEIMQYVRSQVLEIKPKLFIESASAVGANSRRIIWKHIFPNIIPGLISILSLEMGAVLMLLGELGFIGIFIGGGAFAELEIWGPPYHYSDVPEWGALLSNIRIYARSYPWTALYPAGAFFVAITGFNFFGEGIRRMIETVGVAATRLFVNKYTIVIMGILTAVFFWFRGTTGSTAVFQTQAKVFDGYRALAYTQVLSDPRWKGRALGTDSMDQAAEYIAGEFKAFGLQPAGEKLTYYQTKPRDFEVLIGRPYFSINDTDYQPIYQQDYVEYVGRYRNLGSAECEVTFLGFGDLMQVGQWFQNYPALDELDFSGEIVMVLSGSSAAMINDVPKAGLLVVTEDPVLMNRRYTLSYRDPFFNPFGSTEIFGQDTPILRISPEVADHLLADTDYQLDSLRFEVDDLKQDEILVIPTGKTAAMDVQGYIYEDQEARHVIGHLPGVKGNRLAQLDNHLIVVLAQYDSPPQTIGEPVSVAANDNASGVALMLELIRTMKDSGYQPNKTFLFIAYAGEGQEGGEWVTPDISKFLQTKYGFSSSLELEAVIEIRGVGAGSGDAVLLSTSGSLRLVELFESSARRMRIPVKRAEDRIDLSVLFEEASTYSTADEAPYVGLYWDGWWETGGTVDDDLETINPEYLQKTGEVLSLGLMVIGREVNY